MTAPCGVEPAALVSGPLPTAIGRRHTDQGDTLHCPDRMQFHPGIQTPSTAVTECLNVGFKVKQEIRVARNVLASKSIRRSKRGPDTPA